MSVSLTEQETVINFSRDSQKATVWTCDRTVMTKLDKLVEKSDAYHLDGVDRTDGEVTDKHYTIDDKSLISFRLNKVKRKLTDEQRQALADRMKNNMGYGS